MPYTASMHARVIVPLIGLHLNGIGLTFICDIIFTMVVTAFCLSRWSRLGGYICSGLLFLGGAIIFITTPLYEGAYTILTESSYTRFGEGSAGYLAVVYMFICLFALITIGTFLIDPGPDWRGPEDDSPEDDGGPPSHGPGVDWSAFDRERAGWSRPRDGALTS